MGNPLDGFDLGAYQYAKSFTRQPKPDTLMFEVTILQFILAER